MKWVIGVGTECCITVVIKPLVDFTVSLFCIENTKKMLTRIK